MIKNVLVSAGVSLLVVALGFALLGQPSERVIEKTVERIGAFPGTSFSADSLEYNGIPYHYRRQAFETGSTTRSVVCSIRRPALNSSTTIVYASGKILGMGTSSGSDVFGIYTGINMTSTTTLIAGVAVTATGTAAVATTTLASDSVVMAGGDEYLNFDYEGIPLPYLGISGQTGVCEAIWIES